MSHPDVIPGSQPTGVAVFPAMGRGAPYGLAHGSFIDTAAPGGARRVGNRRIPMPLGGVVGPTATFLTDPSGKGSRSHAARPQPLSDVANGAGIGRRRGVSSGSFR